MKLKTKSSILALGTLAVAGFTIWPGCGSVPLPSKHHPISNLQARDFAFEKGAHPTRQEIFAKLGQPDEYFPDFKVACYKLERLTRHEVNLVFFLPVYIGKDSPRLRVALLQFDDGDRLMRSEVRAVPENQYPKFWQNFAMHWSKEPYVGHKEH